MTEFNNFKQRKKDKSKEKSSNFRKNKPSQ